MMTVVFPSMAFAVKLPGEVAFAVGSFQVYWYGIFFAASILAAIFIASLEAKRKQLHPDTVVDLCLVMIPSGVVGARLWYVIEHFELYQGQAFQMLKFWDGGLSLYGAILFSAVGLFIYALKTKVHVSRLLDTVAPGIVLAQGISMWGDFFHQQGYGPEIFNENLMWFPFAVLIEKTDTIHYAAFFYEFLWCILVFALLWFVIRRRAKHNGVVFLWYLLLYCVGHGLISTLRNTDSTLFGTVSLAQMVCAALALISMGILLGIRRKPLPRPPVAEGTDGKNESVPLETVVTLTKEESDALPDGAILPTESAAPSQPDPSEKDSSSTP